MRSPHSLIQTYVPVTDNARFNEIDEHYKRNGRQCGICGEWKINLSAHISTQHTGSTYALISNGEATRDKRRSLAQRRKNERLKTIFPPEVLARIRDMNDSLPPKVRHSGGQFLKGPLQGQEVPGLPQFFEKSSGRLKYCYMDLVKKPEMSPRPRAVFRRTCNMSPAEPFPNKSWFRGSGLSVVTTITTNVWTPDKYPDWTGPPGFLAGKDPTWIPKGLRQCAFCNQSVCDCIRKKVRHDEPCIRKTPNMGEGALARTDYEKDEFLGELVGELAPIAHYTDGWAADLFRDDLSPDRKEVAWCQVYPRYMGNWVRKVNHSCESNCVFESWNISGRWRVMLRATCQIKRGSWILVNYGEEYWQENHRCLCGSNYCVSDRDSRTRRAQETQEEKLAPGSRVSPC
ncbi:SET domain-containing protein [Fusarium oxysporum f. sp. raphani]|uniref:SET domain-containing protein n=1 Tax=Fusarium oxysporum f. sp. raphani TaxID=96318 RepID=A0A8J5NWD3_FUSOX|nr:SET domain-containing protein [Fusarium oxysporum f. sp. raphani]